jgi:hypothetical protein
MDIFYDILNLGNSDTWVVYLAACLISFMPFATLGFLFSKHRDEEPSYLISIDKVKSLKNAWTLLLLLIVPLIFIYNVFVWSGYAFVVTAHFLAFIIKSVYDLIVDYVIKPLIESVIKPLWEFIKTILPLWKIIKWIVSSIIWVFWNIFWMPVKIVFLSLYHYCILWVWDLYKVSFQSIKGTYEKSRLRVTFTGAFYTLGILGSSIYLAILFGYDIIAFIGLIVAILPSIKAYGTATSMLHYKDERDHSLHGKKVMDTALNYVIASIVGVLAIELLLLLSWIPDLGLVFLGVAINTNVFLSALVILSLIVLFFAEAIFPNHLLYKDESTSMPDSIMSYLASIRDRGLQIVLSLIPASIWVSLILLIPAAIIYLSVSTSESLKNDVLTQRGENIAKDINEVAEEVDSLLFSDSISELEDAFESAIAFEVRSQQNTFGLGFPQNVIEQPEIIFDNNFTSWTGELPDMLKGLINDTVIIKKKIIDSELLIKKITTHITDYKDQTWEFKIQRKLKKDNKDQWTTISSGNDISRIVDKNITEGKAYVYRIMAVNKNGQSAWSGEYNKIIGKKVLTPPSSLAISSESNFRLVFSWNDNSNNEDGFIIERRLSGKDGKWSEYASVGSDISQYIVSDVRSKHVRKYDYRVLAQGMGGKSKPTATKSHQLILESPRNLKANANLKSVRVDWAYSFGYNTKDWDWVNYSRRTGSITSNKADGVFALGEKSLSDIMQIRIDEEEAVLVKSRLDLALAKERVDACESLISYDKSQRTMLKVFKNFAFIFAILFTALFGGILLAIMMSYISKLFYNVFTIRKDEPLYFMSLIKDEKSKNNNQPLLAFSIWILAFIFFGGGLVFITEVTSYLPF